MPFARLMTQFSEACQRTTKVADLLSLTEAAARELGFSRVAMVHGMAFRTPGRGLIHMENFGEWAEIFVRRHYYRDDPGLLAAQRTNASFGWEAIRGMIPFAERQSVILREAARHGLRNGYTVPMGVPGEPHGCCSFATDAEELPPLVHRMTASWIAAEAFREARRLHGFPMRAVDLPRLGRRKLECLRWLALGKTDPEIAIILGLSPATIRSYMALLRRDFDVVSRSQLIVIALRAGLVAYDDAIPSF